MVSINEEILRGYLDYYNNDNLEAWLGRQVTQFIQKHVEKDRKSLESNHCEDNIWIYDMKDMIHIKRDTYYLISVATLTNKNLKYGSCRRGSQIFLIEYNPLHDHKICLFGYANKLHEICMVYDRDARYGEIWKNNTKLAGFTCQSERRCEYLYTFLADDGPYHLKIGRLIYGESDIELKVGYQEVFRFTSRMSSGETFPDFMRLLLSQFTRFLPGRQLYSGHRQIIPGDILPIFMDEEYEPAYIILLFHRLCYHETSGAG